MNIIDKAIERVRGNWYQGNLGDYLGDGPVCGIGAVFSVAEREHIAHAIQFDAVSLLHQHTDKLGYNSFGDFNDDKNTTEEDVILAMKHVSATYDERQGVSA